MFQKNKTLLTKTKDNLYCTFSKSKITNKMQERTVYAYY